MTTTYGTVDKNYTSHFNTAVNGDNGDELLKQLKLSYSTDAYDKDGKPTNDVKEGGYDLLVTAKGSLDHDDYDVTVKNANVTPEQGHSGHRYHWRQQRLWRCNRCQGGFGQVCFFPRERQR